MRISSTTLFQQGLTGIGDRQVTLARIQQQLSTGTRMSTAADDPVAWSTAIGVDRAVAEIEQFTSNSNVLRNRLDLAEANLGNVGDRLGRIRELLLQGANGIHTDDQRRAIAGEIRQHMRAVRDLANQPDGNSRYLYGGSADAVPPFAFGSAGPTYAGDQNQRWLNVAPETAVADVDPGSEIFLRIRTGNGVFTTRAAASNLGESVLQSTAMFDPAAWDGGDYRIVFNAGNWQVLDSASATVASGAYTAGTPIDFRGVRIVIEGGPADGDTFNVGPSRTQDVFTTMQRIVDTLEAQSISPQQLGALRNGIYAGIEDLTRAQEHIIDKRAGFGARLNTVQYAADGRAGTTVLLKTTLSELRDLDYAKAISQLNLEMTALQAAQQSFVRVQGLSLFAYLR